MIKTLGDSSYSSCSNCSVSCHSDPRSNAFVMAKRKGTNDGALVVAEPQPKKSSRAACVCKLCDCTSADKAAKPSNMFKSFHSLGDSPQEL